MVAQQRGKSASISVVLQGIMGVVYYTLLIQFVLDVLGTAVQRKAITYGDCILTPCIIQAKV